MRGLARITFERLFRLHTYACSRAVIQQAFPDNLSQRVAVAIRQRLLNHQYDSESHMQLQAALHELAVIERISQPTW